MSVKKVIKNVPTTYWETSDGKTFTKQKTAEMHEIILSANSVFVVIDDICLRGIKNGILAIYQSEKEAKENYPRNEVRQVYLGIPLDMYLEPRYVV